MRFWENIYDEKLVVLSVAKEGANWGHNVFNTQRNKNTAVKVYCSLFIFNLRTFHYIIYKGHSSNKRKWRRLRDDC